MSKTPAWALARVNSPVRINVRPAPPRWDELRLGSGDEAEHDISVPAVADDTTDSNDDARHRALPSAENYEYWDAVCRDLDKVAGVEPAANVIPDRGDESGRDLVEIQGNNAPQPMANDDLEVIRLDSVEETKGVRRPGNVREAWGEGSEATHVGSVEETGVWRTGNGRQGWGDKAEVIVLDSGEDTGMSRGNILQEWGDEGDTTQQEMRELERPLPANKSEDWVDTFVDSGEGPGQDDMPSEGDSAYDSNTPSSELEPKTLGKRPNDVVTVDIPEENDEIPSQCQPHLHTYLRFLYAIGVSAYGGSEEERNGRNRVIAGFQMVGFVLLSTLAFMLALQNLKYYCLEFAMDKKLLHYVRIGLHAFHCLSAVYFVKFAAFDWKKITNMLDILRERNVDDCEKNSDKKIPVSRVAVCVGATSVILAFMSILFNGFTVKAVLAGDPFLYRSYDIGYTLFVWDVNNQTDQKLDALALEYGQEFTPASVTFGMLGSLMEFSGSLQNTAIRDLMLLAGLTLHHHVADFSVNLVSSVGLAEQIKKFRHLQDISKNMASTMGTLLTILHVKNLLLFTDFLLKLLQPKYHMMALLFIAIDMVKTVVTYIVAAKVSRINQKMRARIHAQRHHKDTTQADGSTMMLDLDEIKSEPVGLGSGLSFISASFFAKFAGYVTSCFLFFASDILEKH